MSDTRPKRTRRRSRTSTKSRGLREAALDTLLDFMRIDGVARDFLNREVNPALRLPLVEMMFKGMYVKGDVRNPSRLLVVLCGIIARYKNNAKQGYRNIWRRASRLGALPITPLVRTAPPLTHDLVHPHHHTTTSPSHHHTTPEPKQATLVLPTQDTCVTPTGDRVPSTPGFGVHDVLFRQQPPVHTRKKQFLWGIFTLLDPVVQPSPFGPSLLTHV